MAATAVELRWSRRRLPLRQRFAQALIFALQAADMRANGAKRVFQFFFAETLGDMPRTIPIIGLQTEMHDALRFGLVAWQREHRLEFGDFAERLRRHMRKEFQPTAPGIIHQQHGDAIIGVCVAETEILAVTAKIQERQPSLVKYAQKTLGPAAMLHIRPAALRHR